MGPDKNSGFDGSVLTGTDEEEIDNDGGGGGVVDKLAVWIARCNLVINGSRSIFNLSNDVITDDG